MMSFLSLLASAAQIGLKVWNWFTQKKHDELVQDAQRATDGEVNAGAALTEVQEAKEARDSVASDLAAHPDSLRQSDGFAVGGDTASQRDR